MLNCGCGGESTAISNRDGGPPKVLDLLDPPGAQIGLHYGQAIDLRVQYHETDSAKTAVRGAVRFRIFGDPAGSTLSSDQESADDQGLATVRLTAGDAEASFKVTASADNAPDVAFEISVSKESFVALTASLTWSEPANLRAILYQSTSCAALGITEAAPSGEFRELSQSDVTSADLAFLNFSSRDLAVLGRAEDANGHLLGYACADLPKDLLPQGSTSRIPLLLTPAIASPIGSYTLTTHLGSPVGSGIGQIATAPWHAFTGCENAPADVVLDAISATLTSGLKSAIEGTRGAAESDRCRPDSLSGGGDSLDKQLAALLTAGSPGAELSAIGDDLDSIVSSDILTSNLVLIGSPPSSSSANFAAIHTLNTLSKTLNGITYELAIDTEALSTISASGIAVSAMGAQLTFSGHDFTAGLAPFWGRALAALSLTSRVPTVLPSDAPHLVAAVIASASRNGKTGCAAVEDLICTVTGASSCVGPVATACTSAIDTIGSGLTAGFAAPTSFDLHLAGSVSAVDTDFDLAVDALQGGIWQSPGASVATFSGVRD